MVASPPAPAPVPIPRPRNHDLYTQYIRRRRHRYQARPYLGGRRHYLGSFPTYHDARRAVVKFFAGQYRPLPKFVRAVFADGRQCHSAADAQGFVAEVRTPLLRFRSPVFTSREEAHAAAVAHLSALLAHLHTVLAHLRDPHHAAHLTALADRIRDMLRPHADRPKAKRRPAPAPA